MSKQVAVQILRTNLLEHPAVKAWSELQPERVEPLAIELLKKRRRRGVYRLQGVGPARSAVVAKRSWRSTAVIEQFIYADVLAHLPLPTLSCYGCVEEQDTEFCWLFLEDAGREKYSPVNREHSALAARWLATLQTASVSAHLKTRLPDRGPSHYLKLLRSGREEVLRNLGNPALQAGDLAVLRAIVSHCDVLAEHWSDVEEFCATMPRSLVHGDFHGRNSCVRTSPSGIALLPFDWANAGWGFPAADLGQSALPFHDFVANDPDAAAYWSVVRDHWPGLDPETILRLAHVGKIFWFLAALHVDSPSLAYEWVERRMRQMRRYEFGLVHSIQGLIGRTESVKASLPQFPDSKTLTLGLTSVFRSSGDGLCEVTILDRKPAVEASTSPSEIVTCRLGDGNELRLFCKYAASHNRTSHGHRRGLAHEAAVYRHLLKPSQLSTPTFYGSHTDTTTGQTWLILEFLEGSVRVNQTPEPAATMPLAAGWIGRFHAAAEELLSSAPESFLNTYDAEYYLGWVRRTSQFAGDLHRRFPWLATLCERFEDAVRLLLKPPLTIIHGEYYRENVLFRGGVTYPVDWESAAIAAGEIDLATLTERWPAEIARQCELEYERARRPEGSPADFAQVLGVARLYVHFRWLGDRPEWTMGERYLWRFEQLRSGAERLGLIWDAR